MGPPPIARSLRLALLALLVSSPARSADEPPRAGPCLAQVDGLAGAAAVDVDAEGRLYVALREAGAVAVLGPRGEPVTRWGRPGTAPGELDRPAGLALAPDGRVFVAEAGSHRIQRFTRQGRFEHAFGGRGHAPGQLDGPGGLCFDAGRLFVADTGNHRVQVFDAEGELLAVHGAHGGGPDELRFPADVAVDEQGTLYVADRGNDRIVRRDAGGRLAAWGDRGPYPGLFLAPSAVCWSGGRLYVADRDNHRVQVFDASGARLYEWGLHALRPREGHGALHYPDGLAVLAAPGPGGLLAAVTESLEDRVQLFGVATDASGRWAADPTVRGGLAPHYGPRVTAAGSLLVLTEPETRSVLVFDARSTRPVLVHRLGGPGSTAGTFLEVTDVALAPDGVSLLVADRAARRLSLHRLDHDRDAELRFDPALSHLVWSLDLPTRLGREVEPVAVAATRSGTVYLAEALGPSILVLDDRLRLARTLAGPASGAGSPRLEEPVDLALSPDERVLFVADAGAGRVWALGRDGRLVPAYGQADGEDAVVRGDPAAVAVDGEGRLVVVDRLGHRVRVLDDAGRERATWGGRGLGAGEFWKPRGVAVDGSGRVRVVDHGNHRLQTFDAGGLFLGAFGPRLYVQPTRAESSPPGPRETNRPRPPDDESS